MQAADMSLEANFARLLDHAPKVMCPGCQVEMTLRHLVPVGRSEANLFTATYRCPQCTTESSREFVCEL